MKQIMNLKNKIKQIIIVFFFLVIIIILLVLSIAFLIYIESLCYSNAHVENIYNYTEHGINFIKLRKSLNFYDINKLRLYNYNIWLQYYSNYSFCSFRRFMVYKDKVLNFTYISDNFIENDYKSRYEYCNLCNKISNYDGVSKKYVFKHFFIEPKVFNEMILHQLNNRLKWVNSEILRIDNKLYLIRLEEQEMRRIARILEMDRVREMNRELHENLNMIRDNCNNNPNTVGLKNNYLNTIGLQNNNSNNIALQNVSNYVFNQVHNQVYKPSLSMKKRDFVDSLESKTYIRFSNFDHHKLSNQFDHHKRRYDRLMK